MVDFASELFGLSTIFGMSFSPRTTTWTDLKRGKKEKRIDERPPTQSVHPRTDIAYSGGGVSGVAWRIGILCSRLYDPEMKGRRCKVSIRVPKLPILVEGFRGLRGESVFNCRLYDPERTCEFVRGFNV